MAKVKVTWFEIVTRATEVEIDGYPADLELAGYIRSRKEIQEALDHLTDKERAESVIEKGPATIEMVDILREGEKTPEIVAPRKKYEDEF